MKVILKVTAGFLVLLVLLYLLLSFFVNTALLDRDKGFTYTDCHKIWSARGLYGESVQENSLESIAMAFDKQFKGIEIDVFFDPELKRYVVSHDRPYNRINGELLYLSSVFEQASSDQQYWIDFKKLRFLKGVHIQDAIAVMDAIATKYQIKDRLYIEGADPVNLSKFKKAGFNALFDIHPLPESLPLTSFQLNIYKMFYYFGGFDAIAIKHGDLDDPIYGAHTQQLLQNIPTFVYHVPDESALIQTLLDQPDLKVMLIGKAQSIDRHLLSECES